MAEEGKERSRRRLLEWLEKPGHLRIALTGMILAVGYALIYLPLDGAAEDLRRKTQAEQRRAALARQVEKLRAQYARFKDRLPPRADPNEWVQYVLGGARGLPLKLITLDVEPVRELGPYRVVVLRIELEGTFRDLQRFLAWLENNQRLFRVDTVKLEPQRKSADHLTLQVTVLGVMG